VRYWISAQSPPLKGSPAQRLDCLWLAEGREAAGFELEPGDLVLVYQSKSGRAVRRRSADGAEEWVQTIEGHQGIAAVAEVEERVTRDARIGKTEYIDGTELCWCWRAPINAFSTDGYVPLLDVNGILGFKSTYNFGGFAYRNSGLRQIEADQYWSLVEIFRSNAKGGRPVGDSIRSSHPRSACGQRQELEAHRLLVEYVAADPTFALREAGLETLSVAHQLPAGESADLVLGDRAGAVVAVQVDAEEDRLATVAHASIRRAMLELEMQRGSGQSRVFVVAHSVSPEMRELYASYGIECFAIDEDLVRSWHGHRTSSNAASIGRETSRC
jgi:hypothetical protein